MAKSVPASPFLREFAYTALFNMPQSERFCLKGRFYKLAKSNRSARMYCDKASEEDIKLLLSMMGFEWHLVLHKKTSFDWKKVVFDLFKETAKKMQLKDPNIHVTSDKSLAHNLVLINQAGSIPSYKKYLELSRAGYHTRKWNRYLHDGDTEQSAEDLESMRYLATTIRNSYLNFKTSEFPENELLILIYLYERKESFSDMENIEQSFHSFFKKNKITTSLRKLLDAGLVSRHIKERSFTISGLGIHKLNKYFQQVLTANNF